MVLRNILFGAGLIGLLTGCGDITVPEAGSLSGRIIWDLNGDGTYEASPGAVLTLDNAPYAIVGETFSDSGPGGGLRCTHPYYAQCTVSLRDGSFAFGGISEGSHRLYVLNLENPHQIGGQGARTYSIKKDFFINKNTETKTGDIRLEETFTIESLKGLFRSTFRELFGS